VPPKIENDPGTCVTSSAIGLRSDAGLTTISLPRSRGDRVFPDCAALLRQALSSRSAGVASKARRCQPPPNEIYAPVASNSDVRRVNK